MTETQIHDREQAVDALRRIEHMARLSGWATLGQTMYGNTPCIYISHAAYEGQHYVVEDDGASLRVMRLTGPYDREDVDRVAYHDPEGAILAAYRDAIRRYAETYGQERP